MAKKRLSAGQVFKIVRLIVRAIAEAMEAAESARAPGSPAGSKITPEEAASVVVSALASVADDMQEIIQD
jgi:hypothetical protein